RHRRRRQPVDGHDVTGRQPERLVEDAAYGFVVATLDALDLDPVVVVPLDAVELCSRPSAHRRTRTGGEVLEPEVLAPGRREAGVDVQATAHAGELTGALASAEVVVGAADRTHLRGGDSPALRDGDGQQLRIESLSGHPSTMNKGCDTQCPQPFWR